MPSPYMLNINHPVVGKVYTAYKIHHCLPANYPMSDEQRADFEDLFMMRYTQLADGFEEWVEHYTKVITNPLAAANTPERRATADDHHQTSPDKPPVPAHP